MIPIPPYQWVKERQNRIPLDRISTSAMVEAPVVVNPDTDSNQLFTKDP